MSPSVATERRRPVPAIDPRIRARRIAVQRGAGRRRLRRLGVALGVATVLLGVVGLAVSPLLDVDAVAVSGADHSDPGAVAAATGVRRGDPLLTIDAGGAAEAVRALPWVAGATVERSWPGTVAVEVVERRPVAALLHADGQASLVDADGRVLEVVAAGAAGVVLVAGLDPPGPPGDTVPGAAGRVLGLAGGLPEAVAPAVERIVVDDEGLRLEVRLGDDRAPAEVRLGDDRQLAAKLTALATLFATVDLDGVTVIDLAVPTAPALTRR